MTIPAGKVTDLIKDNPVVAGCTISNEVFENGEVTVTVFSLAAHTSISSTTYTSYHLVTVEKGELSLNIADSQQELKAGDSIVTPKKAAIAVIASEDTTYLEIALPDDASLNQVVEPGQVFQLAKVIPYQDGKIINCDLLSGHTFKLALMALSKGTGLAEHSAPGNAMIFGLDGQGTVTYKGNDKMLANHKALKMRQGARHAVRATQNYQMALLVMTPSTN